MSNFEHAKYDADGVRIDDPTFNTQALRNDTSLVNGITFPAANTVAINTNSVERLRVGNEGQTTILAASSSPALKVTQTGAGNAFVVEDYASTDSTPFVIDNGGRTLIGAGVGYTGVFNSAFLQLHNVGGNTAQSIQRYSADVFSPDLDFCKSRNATTGSHTIVQSGDDLGTLRFAGSDGTNFIQGASIFAEVDGTPGTNDMPGRLVFSTTADGASSPTERMRIDSTGAVGISTALPQVSLYNTRNISGNVTSYGFYEQATVQSDVTSAAFGYRSNLSTAAAAFTLASHYNYYAGQGTIGAGSSITNQYGFVADNTLTGATNNYGFYSSIAAGANRYNFYAAGTAENYFAGTVTGNTVIQAVGISYGKVTTAIPAGGTQAFGMSSTVTMGIYFGSGAPTASAAKGSLYLRSDGSTTNDRMYVNTNGSTTWTAVTTAA